MQSKAAAYDSFNLCLSLANAHISPYSEQVKKKLQQPAIEGFLLMRLMTCGHGNAGAPQRPSTTDVSLGSDGYHYSSSAFKDWYGEHWEYYWEIGKSRMRSDEELTEKAHARHTLELTEMDAADQHKWVLQPTPGADSDWQVASSTGALYDEPYTKSKFMQDRYKKGKERYLSRPIFAEYK